MLAPKQSSESRPIRVVEHNKKLGVVVVLKVAATGVFINNIDIAKDAPTFVASIIEFALKLSREIIE